MPETIHPKACTGTTGEQKIIDAYYRAVAEAEDIRQTIGKRTADRGVGWSALDTLVETGAKIEVYGAMALAIKAVYLNEHQDGGTKRGAFDAAREEAFRIARSNGISSSEPAARLIAEVTRDVALRAATDMGLTLAAKGV